MEVISEFRASVCHGSSDPYGIARRQFNGPSPKQHTPQCRSICEETGQSSSACNLVRNPTVATCRQPWCWDQGNNATCSSMQPVAAAFVTNQNEAEHTTRRVIPMYEYVPPRNQDEKKKSGRHWCMRSHTCILDARVSSWDGHK